MFDASNDDYVVTRLYARALFLTSPCFSRIKEAAAVAATRGDLGQLAPRKKLLKARRVPRNFLRPSKHFGKEGFSFPPPCCPKTTYLRH
jgi:hypothetical protein